MLHSPKTWISGEILIERHTDKEVLKGWTISQEIKQTDKGKEASKHLTNEMAHGYSDT